MIIYTYINKNKKNKETGFSMIEALVSITLLLIALVGPITFFARSSQSAEVANDRVVATFLAQEGAELIRLERDRFVLEGFSDVFAGGTPSDVWSDFQNHVDDCNSGCGVYIRDDGNVSLTSCSSLSDCKLNYDEDRIRSKYFHGAGGDETIFTRVVELDFNGRDDSVDVTSTVSWSTSALAGTQEVETATTIFNLYKDIWE